MIYMKKEMIIMNKVLIAIIVILVIALSIVSLKLVEMTTIAKDNLNLYLQSQDEIHSLMVEKDLAGTDIK